MKNEIKVLRVKCHHQKINVDTNCVLNESYCEINELENHSIQFTMIKDHSSLHVVVGSELPYHSLAFIQVLQENSTHFRKLLIKALKASDLCSIRFLTVTLFWKTLSSLGSSMRRGQMKAAAGFHKLQSYITIYATY